MFCMFMVVPPVVITFQNLATVLHVSTLAFKPQTNGPDNFLEISLKCPNSPPLNSFRLQGIMLRTTLHEVHEVHNLGRDLEPCRLSRYMQVPAGSRCRSTHPRLRPPQAYRPCQSPCSRSTHGVGLRRRRDIFMFTSNRDAQGRLVCFCFAACFRHLRGITLAWYCIPPTTRAIDANPQALL